MFFFHIIGELIMYENDYYYPIKDTKEFLLILINHYVEILLILVYSVVGFLAYQYPRTNFWLEALSIHFWIH